jgi:phosphoenolpyruvate-protein kinase (PTS system EI component)
MTGPSRYRGHPVSEGIGTGVIYLGDPPGKTSGAAGSETSGDPSGKTSGEPSSETSGDPPGKTSGEASSETSGGPAGEGAEGVGAGLDDRILTEDEVRAAFAAVASERAALAGRLRERGQELEAGIVEVGALIAADSALIGPAIDAMRAGTGGVAAVSQSAADQAALLAALPDPDLAQRAGDVRQVAAAVLGYLRGTATPPPPAGKFILVRHEVDPADLIRLAEDGLAGAVSVAGGASSHAAIIARGLGLPMLAGTDPLVLAVRPGRQAILDASAGELIVDPAEAEAAAAALRAARMTAAINPLAAGAGAGVPTADGALVTVLCNVASAAETRLGLAGGAAGVGLLRTEIPFTGASGWPSEADHLGQLTPVLGLLPGKPAVVRLLDFSGDKIPRFLGPGPSPDGPSPDSQQGLVALLGAPGALRDQLRAILLAGAATRLSVLVPMVTSLEEVAKVRAALAKAAAEVGTDPPELGIMVEVADTARDAAAFAPAVDFFSIGTNDLSSEVLGLDRADPRTRPALAADPRVLALIERVVRAGAAAGVKVSVCGDAAADPLVLPLLIGLGVRTLSVGAARVPQVAGWIADLDTTQAARAAAEILQAGPGRVSN